jgi:hypothetical protein
MTAITKQKLRQQHTIHVFPHVKKFMIKTFPHQNGIFKIEEWSTLGSLVTLCLIDNRSWKDRNFSDDYFKEHLTEKIIVRLNKEQLERSPREYKLIRINSEINRLFKEHLVTWIRSQYKVGIPAHQACRSFLEYYKLDPDGTEYNIDNAYKAWQRSQSKKDKID